MSKKIISSILVIIILALSMPIQAFIEVFTSYAVTTSWTFDYTGNVQNLTLPYKGIYKIEAYGAQGGTANSHVIGGKGSYVVGTAQFDKNANLAIYVGGQNGYNGGGAKTSIYGNGGGATDIRYGGSATSNRILVASGGGGSNATPNYHYHSGSSSAYGGCYTVPVYHTHSGNSTNGGACYNSYHTHTNSCYKICGGWVECIGDDGSAGEGEHIRTYRCTGCNREWSEVVSDGDQSYQHICDRSIRICNEEPINTHDLICGKTEGVTVEYYTMGCGKTPGVSIDSYTYINGKTTPSSNSTLYQGSTGGGGGYYGGNTQYAGTNYTSETFSDVTTTEGARGGNGYVKITLVKSYAEVELSQTPTEWTNQDVIITVDAKDEVIGLKEKPYSWEGGERTDVTRYIAQTNKTYKVNVINNYDLEEEKTITITNIDKIDPVVNRIDQAISGNKKETTLTIHASDSANENYGASGVVGYAITRTNVAPTERKDFQESNQFTVNQNGTYYAWVIDRAGNISKLSAGGGDGTGSTILIKDLEIEVLGNITWNDLDNKYNSRVNTEVKLYRRIGEGKESLVETKTITAGQTSYQFQTRETNDKGERYTFRIEEKLMNGYDTVYSQNNVTNTETTNIGIDIANNLILPEYTGELKIEAVDSPENKLLKNANVKMTATIQASNENRESVGVHEGKVVVTFDEKIEVNRNSIKITYEDGQGNKTNIRNDFILWRNTITAYVGSTEQGISMAGGRLTIEMDGILTQIGEYQNEMVFTGKLRDYRGTNTAIDLGTILEKKGEDNKYQVEYQIPEANIQVKNVDSITEEILTDATFVLYEWNGTEYVEKEILTDDNQDGIYESKAYRWTPTSQGKYKIVEEGVPSYHKDLNFSMEYSLEEYQTDNYTVTVDYDNKGYAIQYGKRNPDDLDRIKGVVENEPWKLKAQIEKIDSSTHNVIQAETEFTIYEWNNETNEYEEYTSHTNGQTVKMVRQEDKSYLTEEWLYYTAKNEGKYRIVETKAPAGYSANYDEYDINLVESIETGNYEGQTVENESTIKISNGDSNGDGQNQMTSNRVQATLNVTVVDKETKSIAQADATLVGAKYGLYALEQINHADGVTSRYEGEPGVLYKEDELIETKVTDELGKMIFDNLECGIYYIQMIEAPEGYVLDGTKYSIDFTYQGAEKAHLEKIGQLEIAVKKQAFQLYKLKENQEVLSNAGFSMYLISDLSIVKEGKITRVTKDTYQLNDGTAKGSSQLSGKQNEDGTYYIADLIDYYYKIDFTEENKEQLPGDNEVYHPYNIKENLVKDYSNNEEGNNIEEIRTDSKGYMRSPELAYGEYIVLETSVPREQQVVKGFMIKVQEDSREPQELRFVTDKDFKTKVKIYTKDASTKNTIVNKTASYVIKNEETGEYMTKMQWSGKGFVEQGTIENPFETQKEGYFITPMELPIGKYILEEITAPEGYVVSGKESEAKEKVKFEVASNTVYYMDHYLGNYIIVVEQENEEVVGNITIKSQGEYSNKQENEDGMVDITYEIKMVPNVEYDIYAVEDIYSQDNQKVVRYQKDEKVARVTTDENGEVTIENLPQGKYRIKQISKDGLYLEQEAQEVEISYQGQEIPVVSETIESIERLSKFFIKVEDEDEDGDKMPDMTIKIQDKDGNIVASTDDEDNVLKIEKTKDGYYIEGLPVGEYEIQEIRPDGYKTIEPQKITVENTEEKQGSVLKTRKLIFDVAIEKKLKNIIVNGEVTNVENSNDIMKVEIKERKIPTTKLELQYTITVINKGEVEATVEKILDKIPEGLTYQQEGSANWKVSSEGATYEEKIVLQPGESKEIGITLRWDNNVNNFGEKKNTAELLEVSNPYGYENRSKANGEESASASIVISVGTGLEEKITIVRIIVITFTACMVICLMAAIEIAVLKRKNSLNS